MATPIITLNNLTKIYDEDPAVNNLSLSIRKGEIFGLLGPNGAGKSTTILMMLGLTEPSSGTISVCGLDSITQPLKVKRKVGYLPDNLGFYQHMTGLENLLYTASLNGFSRNESEKSAWELLGKVGLTDAAHKKTGKYSRGMKQRLGLADVLIKEPEVIILDEPTLGIDPKGVRELLLLIQQLNKEQGITVLLSSHQLHQVQQICDRVGIFVKGKLIATGDMEQLLSQLFLEDTYIVEVTVSLIDQVLYSSIEQLSGVHKIERLSTTSMEIYCRKEITSKIAETIISTGVALYSINQKNYGLDEIYHRYFEGRERHEAI